MPDPAERSFRGAFDGFRSWLVCDVLPLWADHGVDRARGGFVEALAQDGAVVDRPRRARVVARQIYSFHIAGARGWLPGAAALVGHGAEALYRNCIRADGLAVSVHAADGRVLIDGFDLYDHAFVLLALAAIAETGPLARDARSAAARMIAAMDAYRHRSGGWIATAGEPDSVLANPHMHMLESCLAFEALPDPDPMWRALSDRIVALAMGALIDPETGALHEVVTADTRGGRGQSQFAVEPGHQFEWTWLLRRWNARAGDPAVERAAARLIDLAERRGVDDRGIVVDGLDADLRVAGPSARLWSQTERVKAQVQAAAHSFGEARYQALERAAQAVRAISRFTDGAGKGLWIDRLDSMGRPLPAPAPASTLYHLVGAADSCAALPIV